MHMWCDLQARLHSELASAAALMSCGLLGSLKVCWEPLCAGSVLSRAPGPLCQQARAQNRPPPKPRDTITTSAFFDSHHWLDEVSFKDICRGQ